MGLRPPQTIGLGLLSFCSTNIDLDCTLLLIHVVFEFKSYVSTIYYFVEISSAHSDKLLCKNLTSQHSLSVTTTAHSCTWRHLASGLCMITHY